MHSLSSQFPTLYHHLQISKQSRSDISLIEEELRLFYYNKGVEVDFCVPEKNLAIQVSYNIDDAETYEREVGGLVKFLKTFKAYHGIIVTWDTEQTINEEGITVEVIPVWKWLLS